MWLALENLKDIYVIRRIISFDDSITIREIKKYGVGVERLPFVKTFKKRFVLSENYIRDKKIYNFVAKNTVKFFETLRLEAV